MVTSRSWVWQQSRSELESGAEAGAAGSGRQNYMVVEVEADHTGRTQLGREVDGGHTDHMQLDQEVDGGHTDYM